MTEKGPTTRLREALALLADPFCAYAELTARERQVMSLALRGYDVPEIAKATSIGRKTVYRDMQSVAEKVTAQDGRKVEWDQLVKLAFRRVELALAG